MAKLVFLGAGVIGQAIAGVVQDQADVSIEFWDKDVTKVPNQKSLTEVIPVADIILLCVPSGAVRMVAEHIRPHLQIGAVVLSVAKGIEISTRQTMDEVLQDSLPAGQPIAMLCGPMLAAEISAGLPAMAVVATATQVAFTRLDSLFANTTLYLEYSADIHGVALASVLKNIYALGVGIGEGLGCGDNWRGWYMSRAIEESAQVLGWLGGQPSTAYGTAGLGDLIATGVSGYSRNHTAGKEIGKNGTTNLTSEGLQSLTPLWQLMQSHQAELPLLSALHQIIMEKHHAQPIFQALLTHS